MSAHYQRAQILIETGRAAEAEKEARAGLGRNPEDRDLMHVLCRALVEQDKLIVANAVAEELVGLAPDWPDAHLMRALVFYKREKYSLAHEAAEEALVLAPDSVHPHGLLGWVLAAQGDWAGALDQAGAGLALDPEDTSCGNLQSMMLVKLGRRVEGEHEMATALRRNPMDTFTQSTAGWVNLERGKQDSSLEHFSEALRIDPMNEHARAGLVEAMKARNPIYRGLLAYCFWMTRLSPRARWAVMLGGFFGYRFLVAFCRAWPELTPVATGLTIGWLSFVVFTWTGYDLFNLILMLDRRGRQVLDARQKLGAVALVVCLAGAAAWLIYAARDGQQDPFYAFIIMLFAFPLTRVFRKRRGANRVIGYIVTGVLGFLLMAGLAEVVFLHHERVLIVGMLGLAAYTWLGNLLDR